MSHLAFGTVVMTKPKEKDGVVKNQIRCLNLRRSAQTRSWFRRSNRMNLQTLHGTTTTRLRARSHAQFHSVGVSVLYISVLGSPSNRQQLPTVVLWWPLDAPKEYGLDSGTTPDVSAIYSSIKRHVLTL